MGYFYWLCVKNANHLHTELSLGYPKEIKFYLESKASIGGFRGGAEGAVAPPFLVQSALLGWLGG